MEDAVSIHADLAMIWHTFYHQHVVDSGQLIDHPWIS
jgi:hypothetical protein